MLQQTFLQYLTTNEYRAPIARVEANQSACTEKVTLLFPKVHQTDDAETAFEARSCLHKSKQDEERDGDVLRVRDPGVEIEGNEKDGLNGRCGWCWRAAGIYVGR